jgi:divalent metal cation (Fe/Co/Zn/Cd) transporter
MAFERASLLVMALRLSFFSVAWGGVVGTAALVVAFVDGSLALAGFALSALLDLSASAVLVWRFRRERQDPIAAEALERRAQSWIAIAMLTASLYVGVQAVRALIDGSHPEASTFGVILAAASLGVLPWLGLWKLRLASGLASVALRGDAILTLAAAVLATVTLMALILTSALSWWWADPAAALIIALALTVEGSRMGMRRHFGMAA